jgi:hypothetical protein
MPPEDDLRHGIPLVGGFAVPLQRVHMVTGVVILQTAVETLLRRPTSMRRLISTVTRGVRAGLARVGWDAGVYLLVSHGEIQSERQQRTVSCQA